MSTPEPIPHDALEETQEVDGNPANGVLRWREPMGPWVRAPELSMRYEVPRIDLTRRQAE